MKISEDNETDVISGVKQRKEAAVRQICIFIDASLLLVDNEILNQETPKGGACLFFIGATDFLTQHYKLDDNEFFQVALHVLRYFGLSEQNAHLLLNELPVISQEPFGHEALIEGGNTIIDWISGKDPNAPLRLFELVNKWKDIRL